MRLGLGRVSGAAGPQHQPPHRAPSYLAHGVHCSAWSPPARFPFRGSSGAAAGWSSGPRAPSREERGRGGRGGQGSGGAGCSVLALRCALLEARVREPSGAARAGREGLGGKGWGQRGGREAAAREGCHWSAASSGGGRGGGRGRTANRCRLRPASPGDRGNFGVWGGGR